MVKSIARFHRAGSSRIAKDIRKAVADLGKAYTKENITLYDSDNADSM